MMVGEALSRGAKTVKVSIIMPAYNHARWVRQALESVLAQTLTDFELIVLDDASSDNSWEVIQQFSAATQDPRLHCIRHPSNQGAPATLNQGLQLAQGEYLTILNSDDVWHPTRLERLLTLAERDTLDFISTDVALLDADSQPKEHAEPHWLAWFERLKQDYAQHGNLPTTLQRGNVLISTSNFFFHRRVYAAVGGFAELRYVHDYEFALRAVDAGFKLRFLDGEKLLGYRLHTTNTIRERPLAAIAENMQMLLGRLGGGLSAQLQDLYRYTNEAWQTEIHHQLQAKERELFPLIADRDQWVAQRDGWIAERDAQLQTLQAAVAGQRQWLAARDQQLQAAQQQLMEHRQWVADRDRWIAERDRLVQHLQQQQFELRNSRAFRLGEALLVPLRWFRHYFGGMGYA